MLFLFPNKIKYLNLSFEAKSPGCSYLLPLLPEGLWRALDFVCLVSHDDVLLFHEASAPPQHAVGALGARPLIRRGLLLSAGHVEAGRTRGEAQVLGVRDLQGAGAEALHQAVTAGLRAGRRPVRLRQGQGRLDEHLFTSTTAGGIYGAWRVGEELIRTGVHL